MLYEMRKKEDLNGIIQYGKADGAFLLHCLLHDICDINNFFVFDSMEEFEKIKNSIPEFITLRADAKIGERQQIEIKEVNNESGIGTLTIPDSFLEKEITVSSS